MNLENLNYAVFVGSVLISIVATVFGAGFYFNKKVKEACAEQNKSMETSMNELAGRVTKLEDEYVPVKIYERDLSDLKGLIKQVHDDVKGGMTALTTRIDLFMTKGG